MPIKNSYKGITFCDSWTKGNKTFEVFKAEFENVWVFKAFEPKTRLSELKKAFKIATKKVADIKVNEPEAVVAE